MHFYTVPSAEKEDFLPAVLDICRRESVQVVIPIVTRELMKFARARAEFEALGAKVSVMMSRTSWRSLITRHTCSMQCARMACARRSTGACIPWRS